MLLHYGLTPDIIKKGILIRSPNWLGDAVMALPAIKCLRKMLPVSSPCYVIAPDNLASLYESLSLVTHIIKIGDGHSKWTRETFKKIKSLDAGFAFLFVNTLRSAWYFRKCVPKLFGASNGLRDFLLTKAFKVKWNKNRTYANEHQSYKYLSMVYKLGGCLWDETYPEFEIISASDIRVEKVSKFCHLKSTLAVAPGAAYGPSKRWAAEEYNRVCRYWIENRGGNVIILGTKNEEESAEAVIKTLPHSKAVLNLTGKTNLKELIYILKNSALCICNDSGIMHLGSALDIKGISIFGSTDPFATGPLSKNWKILIKKQDCSPCFSRECINSLKDYRCLKAITSSDVINTIEQIRL